MPIEPHSPVESSPFPALSRSVRRGGRRCFRVLFALLAGRLTFWLAITCCCRRRRRVQEPESGVDFDGFFAKVLLSFRVLVALPARNQRLLLLFVFSRRWFDLLLIAAGQSGQFGRPRHDLFHILERKFPQSLRVGQAQVSLLQKLNFLLHFFTFVTFSFSFPSPSWSWSSTNERSSLEAGSWKLEARAVLILRRRTPNQQMTGPLARHRPTDRWSAERTCALEPLHCDKGVCARANRKPAPFGRQQW